jgi:hypothetical protein
MNRSLLGLAATAVLTMTVQTGFAAKPVQVARRRNCRMEPPISDQRARRCTLSD